MDCAMGTFLFLPILPGFPGSVMAIVSLLTSAAKLSLVIAECMPREAMPPPAGRQGKKYRGGDRRFESLLLQRRVCEPPVPQLAPCDHVRRHLPEIAGPPRSGGHRYLASQGGCG